MNLIDNNPYRILGVYANSPLRERVANASKARAFLKVGRSVSFPLDLPDILHPLNRTEESFAQAESSVALPSEQLRYALFWFIRMSVVDDVAMKNLMAGDLSAAEDVWRKRECMASAHNLIVYALVRGDLKLAVKYAEIFFGNRDYVSQFAQVVVGDDSSCGDLATIFLDALCEEVDAEDVFYSLGDCELREMVSQKATDKYVECIEGCLSETRQAHGVACLKAGKFLLECAEDWLSCLSDELKTLSISDIRYQSLCEKVSSEVIRCAQEYYRASTDDEKAQNAIGLLSMLRRPIFAKDERIKNNREFKWLFFMEEEQGRQRRAEQEQENVGAATGNEVPPQNTETEKERESTFDDDEYKDRKRAIGACMAGVLVCYVYGVVFTDAVYPVIFAFLGLILGICVFVLFLCLKAFLSEESISGRIYWATNIGAEGFFIIFLLKLMFSH